MDQVVLAVPMQGGKLEMVVLAVAVVGRILLVQIRLQEQAVLAAAAADSCNQAVRNLLDKVD